MLGGQLYAHELIVVAAYMAEQLDERFAGHDEFAVEYSGFVYRNGTVVGYVIACDDIAQLDGIFAESHTVSVAGHDEYAVAGDFEVCAVESRSAVVLRYCEYCLVYHCFEVAAAYCEHTVAVEHRHCREG